MEKTEFNPDNARMLVADSWALLRPADLFRLFDTYWENRRVLFIRLAHERPEMSTLAMRTIDEIEAERIAAGLPIDEYDARCRELQSQGMTRGDAQGIVDAELMRA